MIRINLPTGAWVGFVNERFLGKNGAQWEVHAQVVEVNEDTLLIRIPGHSPTGSIVQAPVRGIDPNGPIEATAS